MEFNFLKLKLIIAIENYYDYETLIRKNSLLSTCHVKMSMLFFIYFRNNMFVISCKNL